MVGRGSRWIVRAFSVLGSGMAMGVFVPWFALAHPTAYGIWGSDGMSVIAMRAV